MARREKKYYFIYKTTNLLNGKYYIGMHSTDNLDDGYLGSGKRLRYSINKYGKDNHKREILEYLPNRKSLIMRETEIVNLNEIAKVDCMNLMVGGKGGFISKEQQKHRASCGGKANSLKLKNDVEHRNNVSKKISEKAKIRHSNGGYDYSILNNYWIGKEHSEKTKRKISNSAKGKYCGSDNSQYGTCWITDGINNKKIYKGDNIPDNWELGRILKK